METTDKIAFIGGHLTPALAVLEEFQKRGYSNFIWFGQRYSQTNASNPSAEYTLITEANIPFYGVRAGKLWRKWTPATFLKGLFNLILIPWGIVSAFILLLRTKPRLVLSFGGYLAFPLVFAAHFLGIRSATHEQTLAIGTANKQIARYADVILLSWQENLEQLPSKLLSKAVVTGNPVRSSLFEVTTDVFNFPDKLPLIYVTGGNQGANTINWRLFKILPELLLHANVVHQVGGSSITNDLLNAQKAQQALPLELQQRYRYFENIYGAEISELFHKADLIVSRAGANTITEIMLLGKPALLIPIPWSANREQQLNAELVAATGLGMILEQKDEMEPQELLHAIMQGLDTASSYKSFNGGSITVAREQAQQKVQPEAARLIVDRLVKA